MEGERDEGDEVDEVGRRGRRGRRGHSSWGRREGIDGDLMAKKRENEK